MTDSIYCRIDVAENSDGVKVVQDTCSDDGSGDNDDEDDDVDDEDGKSSDMDEDN